MSQFFHHRSSSRNYFLTREPHLALTFESLEEAANFMRQMRIFDYHDMKFPPTVTIDTRAQLNLVKRDGNTAIWRPYIYTVTPDEADIISIMRM